MTSEYTNTVDGTITSFEKKLIATISEAYDDFTVAFENDWDPYFHEQARQSIGRKDILALHSINSSAAKKTIRKIHDTVFDYLQQHIESFICIAKERITDLLQESEAGTELLEKMFDDVWCNTLDAVVQHEKFEKGNFISKIIATTLSNSLFDIFFLSSGVIIDPFPVFPQMSILFSAISFSKLMVDPSGIFIPIKKKYTILLRENKSAVLDNLKKKICDQHSGISWHTDADKGMQDNENASIPRYVK